MIINGPVAVALIVLGLGIWVFETVRKVQGIADRRRRHRPASPPGPETAAPADSAAEPMTPLPYALKAPQTGSAPPGSGTGNDTADAIMLMERYERTGDRDCLRDGTELFRRALATAPDDGITTAERMTNLATALRQRFQAFGTPHDVDESVALARQALDRRSDGSQGAHYALRCLAASLHVRFRAMGDPADLEEATACGLRALDDMPPHDPDRPALLAEAADTLRQRHAATGSLEDLDAAVRMAHEAVELAAEHTGPDADAVRLQSDHNLAVVLGSRVESAGSDQDRQAEDEATAIDLFERVLRQMAPGDVRRPSVTLNLVTLLGQRYERTGDRDTADRAAALVADVPEAPPLHEDATRRHHVATAIGFRRFGERGELADIDAAVDHARAAVADSGGDDPIALINLSVTLLTRFDSHASESDLDNGVEVAWQAVAAAARRGTDTGSALHHLGVALWTRHEHRHTLSDIEAAVDTLRRAAPLLREAPARHRSVTNHLAVALLARYTRRRDPADLDEATAHLVALLGRVEEGDPERPAYLSNLARIAHTHAVLHRQAGRTTEALLGLDAAVDHTQEAIDSLPTDHPQHAWCRGNIASYLMERHEITGRADDLAAAEAHLETALRRVPAGHADRLRYQLSLASVLSRRPPHVEAEEGTTAEQSATTRACALLAEVAATAVAPSMYRLWAARQLGFVHARLGDWPAAHEAYAHAVELIPTVAWHGLEYADREQLLAEAATLASDAAAAALTAGAGAERALELLEQGRGVLLHQALDTRTDRTALHAVAPDLERRMAEIRDALDSAAADRHGEYAAGARLGPAQARALDERYRQELAAEWDALAEEARRRGLPDFLRPLPYARLRAAASQGPVVVVNVSRHRCDALLMTADGLEVLPLPRVSLQALVHRMTQLAWVLGDQDDDGAQDGPDAVRPDGDDNPPEDLRDLLVEQLRWLWDEIALPVLDRLGIGAPADDADALPRLWWCPTGPLAFLPLHAAGRRPAPTAQGAPEALMDRAVSSYTPTLRFLLDARARGRTAGTGPLTLTAVALPDTPGLAPLPMAEREIRAVTASFPDAHVLIGPDATRDALRSHLADRPFFHFAGHGTQDVLAPGSGALYCHDHERTGPLTVADIAGLHLPGAQLAFLSACDTARGTARVADESVHLSGALNIAGFRHVVAAQWPIRDARAVRIAADFYRLLAPAGAAASVADRSGLALHRAVRDLRDRRPDAPELWAPYVHSGP
ncbi:CHAT domain-containing protein [Streptomyces sp. NPDC046915]|uniref:CHAT domain-containing protein n=1 Tax=Streptomyces sp. NPDC046915 TaxID=3155257 RepID=UPI0033F0398E